MPSCLRPSVDANRLGAVSYRKVRKVNNIAIFHSHMQFAFTTWLRIANSSRNFIVTIQKYSEITAITPSVHIQHTIHTIRQT